MFGISNSSNLSNMKKAWEILRNPSQPNHTKILELCEEFQIHSESSLIFTDNDLLTQFSSLLDMKASAEFDKNVSDHWFNMVSGVADF